MANDVEQTRVRIMSPGSQVENLDSYSSRERSSTVSAYFLPAPRLDFVSRGRPGSSGIVLGPCSPKMKEII